MLEIILIIVVLLSFPLVALFGKKLEVEKWSLSYFIIGNKNRNAFPIAAGISMSFVGGAATLNMSSLGYQYGWSVLIDPIVVFIALLIAVIFASKIRASNGITISELLSNTSPFLKLILGLTSFFVYQLLTAAQFVAIGRLLSPFFPQVPIEFIVIFVTIVVFSYIYMRGFDSVTRTDILQFVIIISLFLLPSVIILINNIEITTNSYIVSPSAPISLLIYLALPLFFVPVSLDTNIRIKAAKSVKKARIGLLMGGLFYFLLVGGSIAIGNFMKMSGYLTEIPEQILPIFFQEYFLSFSIISSLAILAAIVSTLDSFAFDSIVSLSNDLLKPFNSKIKLSERSMLIISSSAVLIIGLIIALIFQQILGLILAAMLIYVSIFIPVAIGRLIKIPDKILAITSLLLIITLATVKILSIDIPYEPAAFILLHIIIISLTKLVIRK